MASFSKEVKTRLAKRPLKINGRLARVNFLCWHSSANPVMRLWYGYIDRSMGCSYTFMFNFNEALYRSPLDLGSASGSTSNNVLTIYSSPKLRQYISVNGSPGVNCSHITKPKAECFPLYQLELLTGYNTDHWNEIVDKYLSFLMWHGMWQVYCVVYNSTNWIVKNSFNAKSCVKTFHFVSG